MPRPLPAPHRAPSILTQKHCMWTRELCAWTGQASWLGCQGVYSPATYMSCSPVVGVLISSVGVPFLQGDSAGEGKSQQHTHHGVWEGEWSVECGGECDVECGVMGTGVRWGLECGGEWVVVGSGVRCDGECGVVW